MQFTPLLRRAGWAGAVSLALAAPPAHAILFAGLCLLDENCGAKLGSLSGTAIPQAAFNMQFDSFDRLGARLDTLRMAQGSIGLRSYARNDIDFGMAAGDAPARHGVWVRAFGTRESQDARDNFGGYASHGGGVAIGYDHALTAADTVGVSLTYSESSIRYQQQWVGQNANLRSVQGAAYASHGFKYAYVDVMAGYSQQSYGISRQIIGGDSATAGFGGEQWGARLDGGVPFHFGSNAALVPQARVDYSRLRQAGYTENGGFAPLTVAERRAERWRTGLGAQFSFDTALGALKAEPYLNAFWNHDLRNTGISSTVSSSFGSFVSQGQTVPRNTYSTGIGSTFQLSAQVFAQVGYDFEAGAGYKAHSVKAVLKYNF
ncbi:MAG: outer rane autotransporter barrel domain protein [Betaproteobacteria bacterium]|nr:outer rane autotransporter barrel domain protein [Betaproteobacteria bacterium]